MRELPLKSRRSSSRGRLLVHHVALTVAVSSVFGCSDLYNEIFNRDDVARPVLEMPVDVMSTKPQVRSFTLSYGGRYAVTAYLNKRESPGEVQQRTGTVNLAGTIEILDGTGNVRFRQEFDRPFITDQVAGKLLKFHSRAVGTGAPRVLRVSLDVDDRFKKEYSSLTIFVGRDLRVFD